VQIRHHANWAQVLAPAKINLFFAVIRRRDDGFHEIETLMTPISLFDTLVFEDDPSGSVTLQASWAKGLIKHRVDPAAAVQPMRDLEQIPEGDENIVVRAVRRLAEAAKVGRGAKLRLVKRIPSAAGLGGGSSDAAATLLAANRVWNLGWSIERLAVVAAQLGSDVPFFLAGGPAVCRGRGEKIEPVRGLGAIWFVVIRPPEGLSTAAVYGACHPSKSPMPIEAMLTESKRRNWPAVGPVAHNGLLPAARELSPQVGRVIERLDRIGSPLVGMSGSGTGCFALARNGTEARRLARRLQSEGIGRAWAVRSV
jgi:4-diphosphocytidyl-2-C-methyl-D-erythritol kinase